MPQSDNKRIAKNTVLLYIRMILLMAVTLYTSRVILATLGIEDYGIYNLIGGFITIFSFISSSLVASVQRYFNVALGKNDREQFSHIYSMSLNMFAMFSLLLIIVGETLGYWFVANKLNIPAGRETAAMWVYQLSLITTIVTVFRTTDNAAIIAYEKMGFYAYLSIIEAFLKLGIVFMLKAVGGDKLIIYVVLYLATSIIINVAYKIYCSVKLNDCHYHRVWDKPLFKELLSFSGWNLLESGTHTLYSQGVSFFINKYYSVALNAAQGVSAQVYNAVNLFLTNFQTAFKPQLIKTYAAGEYGEHYKLINRTAKFSYFLMIIIVVPLVFNINGLLSLWLVEVPEYTQEFIIFVLIAYLADSIGAPLHTTVYANGNIRGLQVTTSVLYVIQLIICFFFLRARFLPYISAIITAIVHLLVTIISLFYAKKLCHVNIYHFVKYAVSPSIIVTILSLALPFVLRKASVGVVMMFVMCVVDFIWVVFIIYMIGLKKDEKQIINQYIRNIIFRISK